MDFAVVALAAVHGVQGIGARGAKTMAGRQTGPLTGVKVIELTHVMDEHATRIMAAAGKTQPAEVVELRNRKQ